MATRRIVHPCHWALWATAERCPGEGLQIGYPTQSSMHSPARRNPESDGPPPATLTPHDERVARLVAVAVRLLDESGRAQDRRLLRTYYGAHPGASTVRDERMADCCLLTDKAVSATRHQIREAERYVEGWVQGAVEYAEMQA